MVIFKTRLFLRGSKFQRFEFNTDNHGLPTIKDGNAVKGRELQTMWHLLTNWENNNHTDSVLGKLEK